MHIQKHSNLHYLIFKLTHTYFHSHFHILTYTHIPYSHFYSFSHTHFHSHKYTHTHTHFHFHKYTHIFLSMNLVKTLGYTFQTLTFGFFLMSASTLLHAHTHTFPFTQIYTHIFIKAFRKDFRLHTGLHIHNPNLWIISHVYTNTLIITHTHTHTHFHSHKYTNIPLSLDLVKTMGCILQVPRFELSLISTLTLSYSYTHSHLFSHTLTHTFSLSHQTLIINSNIEDRIYDFYFKFHEPEGERTGVKVFFQSGISDPR